MSDAVAARQASRAQRTSASRLAAAFKSRGESTRTRTHASSSPFFWSPGSPGSPGFPNPEPRESVTDRVSRTSAGSVASDRVRRVGFFPLNAFSSRVSLGGRSRRSLVSIPNPGLVSPDNIAHTASYRAASSSKSPVGAMPEKKRRERDGEISPGDAEPAPPRRQAAGASGVRGVVSLDSRPSPPLGGGSNTRISSRSTRSEDVIELPEARDVIAFFEDVPESLRFSNAGARLSRRVGRSRRAENTPRAPEACAVSPRAGSSGRSAGCAALSWSAVTVTVTVSSSFGNGVASGCRGFLNAASVGDRAGDVHARRRAPGGFANRSRKSRAH